MSRGSWNSVRQSIGRTFRHTTVTVENKLLLARSTGSLRRGRSASSPAQYQWKRAPCLSTFFNQAITE